MHLKADQDIVEGKKRNSFEALNKNWDKESNDIMKFCLDNAGAEVAIIIAGYIGTNLSKRSKSKTCPEKSKGGNETNILNDNYFKIFSRAGLTG